MNKFIKTGNKERKKNSVPSNSHDREIFASANFLAVKMGTK
jgi:hypothetical protein